MIHRLEKCSLRPLESKDIQHLYEFKNNPKVAALLGGFHTGLSSDKMVEWLEYHRKKPDEVLWAIADLNDDSCLGHVGLYQIDHRVRSSEFAIMVGASGHWGRGLGRSVTHFVLDWGFSELNLNRIHLSVLATNERAIRLYRSLGFVEEGRLRQAQFKGGRFIDVVLMSILRDEFKRAE
ncbi:MAG TPA: GNAT family protein [Thermodesulfobacteriota bacterium]|nr:GNAT family protein [Thermodesulfobacteriota bacterium]HNU01158.1 GNAT family protein [Acidobacteriota bacterium]